MTNGEKGQISLCPLGTNSTVKDLGKPRGPWEDERQGGGWDQVPIDEN